MHKALTRKPLVHPLIPFPYPRSSNTEGGLQKGGPGSEGSTTSVSVQEALCGPSRSPCLVRRSPLVF